MVKFGEPVVYDIDQSEFADLEDGPFALLESDAWAAAEALTAKIEAEFSGPPVKPESARLDVSFTDTHAVVVSPVDVTVEASGDVKDGPWKLKAGKPSKRKLETKDPFGVVVLDGVTYPIPRNGEEK